LSLPFGRSTAPLPEVSTDGRIPAGLQGFSSTPRLVAPLAADRGMQAWDYWTAWTETLLVCTYLSVARSNLNAVTRRLPAFVIAEDFAYSINRNERSMTLLADVQNRLRTPAHTNAPLRLGRLAGDAAHARWTDDDFSSYAPDARGHVFINAGNGPARFDLSLDVDASVTSSMNLAVEFGHGAFQLNTKGIGLRAASGLARIDGATHDLTGARVAYDFGRGSWPRHATWTWIHAADADGQALNVGSRWAAGLDHENCISSASGLVRLSSDLDVMTRDGIKIAPGNAALDPHIIDLGGEGRLTFTGASGDGWRRIPLESVPHTLLGLPFVPGLRGVQRFGWFTGSVAGVAFNDAFGWIEDVRAKF